MKAVVAAFNQEKALVGAFSVITNLRMFFGWNFLKHYTEAGAGEQQQGAGGGLASGLVNNVANIALRKTDLWNFALFHEGNLHNNLFFKVRDRSIDIQC